jgi:hypothetical protein
MEFADETFPVRWEGGRHPTPANNCAGTADLCNPSFNSVTLVSSCECTANISVTVAFGSTTSEPLPSAADIVEQLAIGASPPDRFDLGTYSLCTTSACNAAAPAVKAYVHSASGATFDTRTIFEVVVNSSATYLFNKVNSIALGEFAFRNPPHFVSFVEPAERDAHHETDALIDHLFTHQNTAPFVSYRLIQRLVTSNPSPRYIAVVAGAFSTGQYDGVTYSGRYGDLGAATAAIFLDREARSFTLDLDPSHGGLREPMVKLLHFLRAMEFVSKDGREIELASIDMTIGQSPFRSP